LLEEGEEFTLLTKLIQNSKQDRSSFYGQSKP
jgi:hypothetical protein